MVLSDFSVTRPVFASVISLLLIAFGIVAFTRLPLREYPDIDPPVVTINTSYPGASASIVETRVTELIEDRIAGVEGINFIESSSSDGQSRVTLEFNIDRDIEAAANDVRDRIAGIVGNLPEEADPPEVQKVDASDDVIIWLSLISASRTTMELTDYAERYLVDRFSILDGVASVRVGGGQSYADEHPDQSRHGVRGVGLQQHRQHGRTEVDRVVRLRHRRQPRGRAARRTGRSRAQPSGGTRGCRGT